MERDSGAGGGGGGSDGKRRRLDGVIPDILKRAVELGVEKATEAPDTIKSLVTDLKLPKEVASLLLTQMEETKNGLFRVVAKEMRDFLEHTNIASEMQKMLTSLQFEITTTIRFSPNGGSAAPSTPPPSEPSADAGEKRSTPPTDAPPPPSMTPLPVVPGLPEVKTDVSITTRDLRPKRRSRE